MHPEGQAWISFVPSWHLDAVSASPRSHFACSLGLNPYHPRTGVSVGSNEWHCYNASHTGNRGFNCITGHKMSRMDSRNGARLYQFGHIHCGATHMKSVEGSRGVFFANPLGLHAIDGNVTSI